MESFVYKRQGGKVIKQNNIYMVANYFITENEWVRNEVTKHLNKQ